MTLNVCTNKGKTDAPGLTHCREGAAMAVATASEPLVPAASAAVLARRALFCWSCCWNHTLNRGQLTPALLPPLLARMQSENLLVPLAAPLPTSTAAAGCTAMLLPVPLLMGPTRAPPPALPLLLSLHTLSSSCTPGLGAAVVEGVWLGVVVELAVADGVWLPVLEAVQLLVEEAVWLGLLLSLAVTLGVPEEVPVSVELPLLLALSLAV